MTYSKPLCIWCDENANANFFKLCGKCEVRIAKGETMKKRKMMDKDFKMGREWKKFDNDELMTIWSGYKAQEFGIYREDPLRQRFYHNKPIRLTPMEILQLVDELMDRLDIKENGDTEEE